MKSGRYSCSMFARRDVQNARPTTPTHLERICSYVPLGLKLEHDRNEYPALGPDISLSYFGPKGVYC